MKIKITLQLDSDLLRDLRILAAEKGIPIETRPTDALERIKDKRKFYNRARRGRCCGYEMVSISAGRSLTPAMNSTTAKQ